MLVICERADPISRRRRQIAALRVEPEHRDRLREGRAPSVAHKPLGRLRVRFGDEVHKAAAKQYHEGEETLRYVDAIP